MERSTDWFDISSDCTMVPGKKTDPQRVLVI